MMMESFDQVAGGKRVVICGSMTFYGEMVAMRRRLRKEGITSVIPDLDRPFGELSEEHEIQEAKRRASMRHIRRVRDQKTLAVLVMNLDKYDIHDYIGPNTFAEIAVAFAHYKPIYTFQGVPAFYKDELVSWRVSNLDGDIARLVSDCRDIVRRQSLQLMLF